MRSPKLASKARPSQACLALAASRRMWALLGGLPVVAARTGMLFGFEVNVKKVKLENCQNLQSTSVHQVRLPNVKKVNAIS